jgi:hypothetical protein
VQYTTVHLYGHQNTIFALFIECSLNMCISMGKLLDSLRFHFGGEFEFDGHSLNYIDGSIAMSLT